MEPESSARVRAIGVTIRKRRRVRHEGAVVLRGHVLQQLLLAYRGPLELLH